MVFESACEAQQVVPRCAALGREPHMLDLCDSSSPDCMCCCIRLYYKLHADFMQFEIIFRAKQMNCRCICKPRKEKTKVTCCCITGIVLNWATPSRTDSAPSFCRKKQQSVRCFETFCGKCVCTRVSTMCTPLSNIQANVLWLDNH